MSLSNGGKLSGFTFFIWPKNVTVNGKKRSFSPFFTETSRALYDTIPDVMTDILILNTAV